ncbi:hypothetical protein [Paenibacillus donghaensis]|uniref:hypothetical protein n=1 Tax=Paenibacillus donghaensis TaxID=414771 RepID=UPI0012F7874C|nr:hypothetical protein [Paenibacillus donghaensis]
MAKSTRKPIDPFFQQRNYFAVKDETGAMAGMVYVLDTAMMPPRQRGARHNDSIHRLRKSRRPR